MTADRFAGWHRQSRARAPRVLSARAVGVARAARRDDDLPAPRRPPRRPRRRASTSRPRIAPSDWVDGRLATIRSPAVTTCGSPTTAAPRSTSAAASSASPATPTCTSRGSTIASSRCSSRTAASIVRVRVLDPGEVARIDTPNTQIALTRPGLYRIDVTRGSRSARRSSCAKARRRCRSQRGVQQVLPGQTAQRRRLGARRYADVRNGIGLDGFDTWSADRDRRYERSRSRNLRVAADGRLRRPRRATVAGRATPDYGAVWYPTTVAAGLGAVPLRLLELGRGLRLDLGRRRAVGLRAVPLRSLGARRRPLGLVPGRLRRTARAGRRRWSAGTAARAGPRRRRYGAPVYGWVPLGWGEPYVPWWRNCSDRCWDALQPAVRGQRRGTPACAADAVRELVRRPGGVTAVPGATFAGPPAGALRTSCAVRAAGDRECAGADAGAGAARKPTAATIPGAKPSHREPPPPAVAIPRRSRGRCAPSRCAGERGAATAGLGGPTSRAASRRTPGQPRRRSGTRPRSLPGTRHSGAGGQRATRVRDRRNRAGAGARVVVRHLAARHRRPRRSGSANVAPPRPQAQRANRAEPRSRAPAADRCSAADAARRPRTYAPQPSRRRVDYRAARRRRTYAPQPSAPVARPAPSAAARAAAPPRSCRRPAYAAAARCARCAAGAKAGGATHGAAGQARRSRAVQR